MVEVRRLDPERGAAELLKRIERRVANQETRPSGEIVIRDSISSIDPVTGIESRFGRLPDGRFGVDQWIGDTVPPAVPSNPHVVYSSGGYTISWDGTFLNGAAKAPDFDHCKVYANNGLITVPVGTLRKPNDTTPFVEIQFGDFWSFWLTSVDENGNESAIGEASPPIEATPLVATEVIIETLDAAETQITNAGQIVLEAGITLAQKLSESDLAQTNLSDDLDTLQNTTLPGLNSRLNSAETSISTTIPNAIQDAQDAADTALLIAPISDRDPVLSDGTGRPVDAVWTKVDANGDEVARWRWTGSAWTPTGLSPTIIPYLSASHITSGTIDTDLLNAIEIAAKTATFQKVDVANITVTGTSSLSDVVAQQIAADSAKFITLGVEQLTVSGTANINTAVIDKLFAQTFSTHRLTANEILIGDYSNIADGGNFEDPELISFNLHSNHFRSNLLAHNGSWSLRALPASGSSQSFFGKIPVTVGDEFYVSFWVYANAEFNGDGNSKLRVGDQNNSIESAIAYNTATKGTWVKMETNVSVTDPATTELQFWLWTTHTLGIVHFDDIEIRRINGGSLIATNSITAPKIVASEELTAKFAQFLTVTANMIESNSINTAQLAAGAITSKHTITGALIQSNIDPNIGVKFDDTGIWSSVTISGVPVETFRLSAFDGTVTATGVFQTDISGPRVKLSDRLTIAAADFFTDNTQQHGALHTVFDATKNRYVTSLNHYYADNAYNAGLSIYDDGQFQFGQFTDTGFKGIWGYPTGQLALGSAGAYVQVKGGLQTFGPVVVGGSEDTAIEFGADATGRTVLRTSAENFTFGRTTGGYIDIDVGRLNAIYGMVTTEWVASETTLYLSHNGAAGLDMGVDGSGRRLVSQDTYNRTYSSAANLYITGYGTIGRSTSSRKHKAAIEPMRDIEDKLLSLETKTWYDIHEAEAVSEHYTLLKEGKDTFDENGRPIFETPDILRRIPGLIGEEVYDAGLTEFIHYGKDGEIEGLMYERLAVALIPIVAKLRDRIGMLEEEINGRNRRGKK